MEYQTLVLTKTSLTLTPVQPLLELTARPETADNHGLLQLKKHQFQHSTLMKEPKQALLHQKLLLHYGLSIMSQKKEKKRSNSKIGSRMKMKLIVIDT